MRWATWRHQHPLATFALAWLTSLAAVIAVCVIWYYANDLLEASAGTAAIAATVICAFSDPPDVYRRNP